MEYVLSGALALVGLSLLVIVHETGHYLAARAFGMRVLRYSLGIGPTVFRYKPRRSETLFQVGAIPFLAYVQIAGMNPHEEGQSSAAKEPSGSFASKSLFARFVTIAAGPLANYAAGILLVFFVSLWGWPEVEPTRPMVVASVAPDSPAEKAGLRKDDVIVEVNGHPVDDVEDLIRFTENRTGQPTLYRIQRKGTELDPIAMTPIDRGGRGVIGVSAHVERVYRSYDPAEAAMAALRIPFELTVAQIDGIASAIRNGSADGLMGPVGMGKLVAEQAQRGVIEYFVMLTLLTVALGMFNLLPLPALDGGRLLFLGYELVVRRKPNQHVEALIHAVGLIVLLGVLVLVTFRDIAGSSTL